MPIASCAFRRIGCRLKHRVQHQHQHQHQHQLPPVSTPALPIKSMRGAVQTQTPAPPLAPPLAPSCGITAPAPFNGSAAPAAFGPNDQAHGTSSGCFDRSLKLTSFSSIESREDGGIQHPTLLHSSPCSMPIFSPLGTSNNPAWSTKFFAAHHGISRTVQVGDAEHRVRRPCCYAHGV